MSNAKAIIALGSNLQSIWGTSLDTINKAINIMQSSDKLDIIRQSPIFITNPVGVIGLNGELPSDFYNSVIEIETSLNPHDLLKYLQSIELDAKRQRHQDPNIKISRTLDLDIISYGDEQINDSDLTIPHPKAKERSFVQIPIDYLTI